MGPKEGTGSAAFPCISMTGEHAVLGRLVVGTRAWPSELRHGPTLGCHLRWSRSGSRQHANTSEGPGLGRGGSCPGTAAPPGCQGPQSPHSGMGDTHTEAGAKSSPGMRGWLPLLDCFLVWAERDPGVHAVLNEWVTPGRLLCWRSAPPPPRGPRLGRRASLTARTAGDPDTSSYCPFPVHPWPSSPCPMLGEQWTRTPHS